MLQSFLHEQSVKRRGFYEFTSQKTPSSRSLATIKCFIFAFLLIIFIPVQSFALLFGKRNGGKLPKYFHSIFLILIGIRLEKFGKASDAPHTIFVANHCSYLDVLVLGASIRGVFISTTEVKGWPIFGTLAKMQRSIFIERKSTASEKNYSQLNQRLKDGDNIILFPEGTSSDGNSILPFRSSLFAVAMQPVNAKPVTIQPISIAYRTLNGTVMGRSLRPLVAWYGDMTMFPHFFTLAGLGKITVQLRFHKPINSADYSDRKQLTKDIFDRVQEGYVKSMSGRDNSEDTG